MNFAWLFTFFSEYFLTTDTLINGSYLTVASWMGPRSIWECTASNVAWGIYYNVSASVVVSVRNTGKDANNNDTYVNQY